MTHDRKHVDEEINCLIRAINLRRENHAHRAALYTNLGAALTNRYNEFRDRGDLHAAIDAHERALTLASKPHLTEGQIVIISNLASDLMQLDLSNPDDTLARRIEELVDAACVAGAAILPTSAFITAVDAARWARLSNRLEQAGDYYQLALRIAYQLFRSQTLRVNMLSRIRAMQSLPAEAAFVMGRLGKGHAAVTVLEQGRALVLTDSLERKYAELDILVNDGHRGLVESYRRAALALDSLIRQSELR